jgi:hypothetical protein
MKRFHRFDMDAYYPAGGLNDCTGSFDTLEAACRAQGPQDFGHIAEVQPDGSLVQVAYYGRLTDYRWVSNG